MSAPNFILLYVENAQSSAKFYASIMGFEPADVSPTFCMFALPSGVKLGLWGQSGVTPPASRPGGSELAFAESGKAAVDAKFATWQARGIKIIQPPVQLDFGYSFTAVDGDGHRLRVFAPGP